MNTDPWPYVANCSFCGDGLLRLYHCSNCDRIVALCDECELMWEDVAALSLDPNLSSDSSYPQCPACGDTESNWLKCSMEEIEEHGLRQFLLGESA